MSIVNPANPLKENSGGKNAGEVYSTDETRIGTWIDGKPLYRRVVENSDPTLLSFFTRTDAILNVDFLPAQEEVDTYTAIYGSVFGNWQYMIPGLIYSGSYATSIGIYATANKSIHFVRSGANGTVANASKVVLTLEYTKTTD